MHRGAKRKTGSMGKRNKRTRRNLKKRKTKRLIDEPKASSEGGHSQHEKDNLPEFSDARLSNTPATARQPQTDQTSDHRQDSKNVMRFFIASWRWSMMSFRFLDKHDGSITALATVAIVVLTFVYVSYSKKQWETMQESNRITRDALISVQRAFVGRLDPIISITEIAGIRGNADI
jgi:hypothetical protein